MLAQYIHQVLNYVAHHPVLGEVFAFVVSFLESLPIIGTIVPGSVTMTAVGVLIGASVLPAFLTITAACVGAFAGDALGFWLGHRYKQQLRTMWPLKKYPKLLTMSENFFKKHGGKSILIGRFVGPIRSTIPMVAGILKMSWGRFTGAAIPSAICWAFLYMTPGILIGALSLELPAGKTTEFILYGFISILVIWFVLWCVHHFFKQLASFINTGNNRLWAWMSLHARSNSIIHFIRNQNDPEDHHQLTLLLVAIFSLLLFLILSVNVAMHTQLLALNRPIFEFLQSIHNPKLTGFFVVFTCLGSSIGLFSLILLVVLLLEKEWRTCLYVLGTLIVVVAAVFFLKHIMHEMRPAGFFMQKSNYAFPSGHTALSLTILGLFAYITATRAPKNIHRGIYSIVSVPIVLVALSRIYLGAHWFFDVIGSMLLGFTILLMSIMLQRRHYSPAVELKAKHWVRWLLTVILAAVISTSVYCFFKFKQVKRDYTPVVKQVTVSYSAWWSSSLSPPIYRSSRFGHPIAPLNLQVAEHLTPLKAQLLAKGWHDALRRKNPTDFTAPAVNKDSHFAHPLLSWLYHNRPPVLFLIKKLPSGHNNIQLRLWTSDFEFKIKSIPLYVGSINYYSPSEKVIHFKKHKAVSFRANGGVRYLLADLPNYQIKIIQKPIQGMPKKIKVLDWNGEVILLSSE